MKALLHFIFFLLTAALGFAQSPSIKEIAIEPQLLGDLYTTASSSDNLAIIVPGSGPTNRNGNSYMGLKGDSYKQLAFALASKSIDVFTYDKRIIAQLKANQVKEEEMRFDDGITDLILIVNYFATQYPNITLIGHSEGALIANLVANTNSKVTKYIALQGPGESADKIIYEQVTKQFPALGEQVNTINQTLKKGVLVEKVPSFLQALYRPSLQPYLISWMKYDPSLEIQKTKQPTLLVDGDKDLQVSIKQGDLLQQANPKAKRITLQNMNHVLKQIDKEEDNLKSYGDPSFPLHPALVSTLSTFILNH